MVRMSLGQPLLLTVLCLWQQWTSVNGGAVVLTTENFESAVEGKNVFIKFYAPWCGHCRAMADDWDKLADDYASNKYALIGEVDCTSDEGQPICSDYEVQSFPTIVHGDPMSAETYDGARDYESMSAFAKDHVSKPICSLYHLDNCSEEEAKMIEGLEQKSDDELKSMVTTVETKVKEREAAFDEKVNVIQNQYDALVEEFNTDLESIKKEYHFKYVEQVIDIRMMEAEHADEDTHGEL